MFRVSITPQWTIEAPEGRSLGARVVELLVQVAEQGSLARACTACGLSYRHAWQLLREGESLFGQPLLVMSRGKGSELTPLGERLVWAQRRIQARLSPALDSLASELGAEIEKLLAPQPGRLRIQASHGFAVQALHDFMARAGVPHELKYCGSVEALESLTNGQCDIAGFHLPLGEFEAAAIDHFRLRLDPARQRVIRLATRRQGLMTRPGNPKKIYGVEDLARADVRFINRQAGSGTRFLLDLMLQARGISPAAIRGYEQCEFTHAAVAAFVASGMADAGMGVEVPAREFKLEFIPLQRERYFLLCHAERIDTPAVQQALGILRSAEYRRAVDALPGYSTDATGSVEPLSSVLGAGVPARKAGTRA
ncbi:substrate-binding domain-containing protein [Ideonella sp. YS5]|uniref:substrate-binding domain-containing protein n=1 Tax=Ideonella sp. YS5 TaxID=3453714 RepID=UPI003EE8C40A